MIGPSDVQKKTGRNPQERSIPQGNINGKWRHDLHEDDGPVRARYRSSCVYMALSVGEYSAAALKSLPSQYVLAAGRQVVRPRKCTMMQ